MEFENSIKIKEGLKKHFILFLNQEFFNYENYKNENLEKYKSGESYNFASKFIKHLKKYKNYWFFLSGTVGNGKTTALKMVANELVEKRISFEFVTLSGVLEKIKNSYNNANCEETEIDIINNLIKTNYLLIDDFGTELLTEWSFSKIFTILNGKYENNTCVIFTSNLTKKKLAQKLTEFDADCRLLDRIKHKTTFVEFKNKSFRKNDFQF